MKCDFCDGPRINGAALERDRDGGWRLNTGSLNPVRSDLKHACRSCATKKLH